MSAEDVMAGLAANMTRLRVRNILDMAHAKAISDSDDVKALVPLLKAGGASQQEIDAAIMASMTARKRT